MKCIRCKEREATGIIFDLCEPCFAIFEAKINEHATASGSYRPEDKELEYIAEPFIRRKD